MAKRKRDKQEDPAPTPAKRQKDRHICRVCGSKRLSKMFPNYNPSTDCQHNINTCKECLKKYVDIQIKEANTIIGGNDGTTFGIPCPETECPAIMRAVNIEIATSKKTSAQFERLERIYTENNTPGWRWCLSPSCNSGQVHESAPDKDGSDIFKCKKCGTRTCVPCDRLYHKGESCEAYQLRTKDHLEEEDKALKAIRRHTRPYPKCEVRIYKIGGCEQMKCK
jgi:ariadne-1